MKVDLSNLPTRQADGECGALTGCRNAIDGAPHLRDDAAHHGQAKACALAYFLGREKRFKNSRHDFRWNTVTVI